MVNAALAAKIYGFISVNPKQHEQADWHLSSSEDACGTTACVAGWATILGRELPLKTRVVSPGCSCCPTYTTYYYEEPVESWEAAGREELGIGLPLSRNLFYRQDNVRAREALKMLSEGKSEEEVNTYLVGEPPSDEPRQCSLGCCTIPPGAEYY